MFFFFNDTATTEIYTLSLHDALPISKLDVVCWEVEKHTRDGRGTVGCAGGSVRLHYEVRLRDRKSTRLNSSHGYISYAVFCLKKKKKHRFQPTTSLHTTCTWDSTVRD